MEQSSARFSFLAERLCLDFTNTVDWHATHHPGERVQNAADLLKWAGEAGILEASAQSQLFQELRKNPRQAEVLLTQARELREAIYRIFVGLSHGQKPTQDDLDALNAARLEAVQHQMFSSGRDNFQLVWTAPSDPACVWWSVALDAADLLTSGLLPRVRQCADDRGCGWLFLDTSKAGRRRWCSMKDCGNRAKVLRHRRKAGRDAV